MLPLIVHCSSSSGSIDSKVIDIEPKEKKMKVEQRRLTGWRRLFLMPLLLPAVLLLVFAASLVLPGTAQAQSGNTVTVASPAHLIARTTVRVSVPATCTLPLADFSFGTVSVTQASGREITQAFGNFAPTCDGTAHTYQVDATLSGGAAPFHGGPATAHANFFASSQSDGSVSADSGTVAIRITG
jgi:hypothetical protein